MSPPHTERPNRFLAGTVLRRSMVAIMSPLPREELVANLANTPCLKAGLPRAGSVKPVGTETGWNLASN
jgi:hypothetical protein